MTDETDKFTGYKIDLPEGRHVFVGELNDCFLIEFRNAQGNITHLKLSREAGDALRYLLGNPIDSPEIVMRMIATLSSAAREQAEQIVWKAVEIDTTPHQSPVGPADHSPQ